MTVCHCSLPVAKAFCFLEDLRWEFTACFNSTVVALAARPYPFLEFGEQEERYCHVFTVDCKGFCFEFEYKMLNNNQGSHLVIIKMLNYKWNTVCNLTQICHPCWELTDSTIQKLKQQYNQSGGPALEVTLAEVQEDLRIHPLQVINLDEVQLTNGIANGHVEQGSGPGKTELDLTAYRIMMKCIYWLSTNTLLDFFALFIWSLNFVKQVKM